MAEKHSKLFEALALAWQLGFLIVVPLGGSLAAGIWLDKTLNSSPLFLLILSLVGIGVASYGVYRKLLPFLGGK